MGIGWFLPGEQHPLRLKLEQQGRFHRPFFLDHEFKVEAK